MVSTQDSESCDPSSNLGRTFSFCFYVLNLETDQEDLHQIKQNIRRARPGFEPGTSRTLSENHTPRPTSHISPPVFCQSHLFEAHVPSLAKTPMQQLIMLESCRVCKIRLYQSDADETIFYCKALNARLRSRSTLTQA